MLFGVVRGIMAPATSNRVVLFFDVDNCVSNLDISELLIGADIS